MSEPTNTDPGNGLEQLPMFPEITNPIAPDSIDYSENPGGVIIDQYETAYPPVSQEEGEIIL